MVEGEGRASHFCESSIMNCSVHFPGRTLVTLQSMWKKEGPWASWVSAGMWTFSEKEVLTGDGLIPNCSFSADTVGL